MEPMKSLTSVRTKNDQVSILNNNVTRENGTQNHHNEHRTEKVANYTVNFANFAKMSTFTSITHLLKPKPPLPNAALDRSRPKLFAIGKRSGCGAILKNFKTLQTINERVNSSIRMVPASIEKKHVLRFIATAKQKQKSNTTTAKTEPCFNVGNKIRIASRNKPLTKGY